MKISHPILFNLVGFLGSKLIYLLHATSRIDRDPESFKKIESFHQEGKQVIYAFWHGKMLVPAYTHRKQKIRILISPHRDGEYIAQVVKRLGFIPVRGSTFRNPAKALIELKTDTIHDVAFTIDGPRGPRHKVTTKGILAVAQHTGWPILPGGIAMSRKWKLKSWDQFEIPKPFAKVYLKTDKALFIPKEAKDLEPYRLLLEERMIKITSETDALVGEIDSSNENKGV